MLDILALFAGFAVIMLMVRKKCNLGFALVSGATAIVFISGAGFLGIGYALYYTIFDIEVWLLIAIVALFSILSYILKETGSLQRMVDVLIKLSASNKLVMVAVPALIGLISVPGGAIVSAPVVDEVGEQLEFNPEQKAAANILFRHMGRFVYPLCRAMILVTGLMEVGAAGIVKKLIPVAIVGLGLSWYQCFGLKKISFSQANITVNGITGFWKKIKNKLLLQCLSDAAPLLIPIILVLLLGIGYQYAIVLGIVTAIIINRIPFAAFYDYFRRGINFSIIITVFAMMFLRTVISEGVMTGVIAYLAHQGFSFYILAAAMPFFIGLATGSSIAPVATAGPLFSHW
ncbi:MAG: DUF401 family protein [bacterium]